VHFFQQIDKESFSSALVNKIYSELIDNYNVAAGIVQKQIDFIINEVEKILLLERQKPDGQRILIMRSENIEEVLSNLGDDYKNDNCKLANIYYLRGWLSQIRFNYIQAYVFFEKSCSLYKNIAYYNAAGELAMKLSKYVSAEKYFRKAVDIGAVNTGKEDNLLLITYGEVLNNLGGALDQQQNFDDAITFYQAAIDYTNKREDSRSVRLLLGVIYNNIGAAFLALSNFKKAEFFLQQSIEIKFKDSAPTREIIITNNVLAEVHRLNKNKSKAKKLLEQSLSLINRDYNQYPNHPLKAHTLNNLGSLSIEMESIKEKNKAIEYFNEALKIWAYIFNDVNNEESIKTTYNLAIAYSYRHHYKKALFFFKKALEDSKEYFTEQSFVYKRIEEDYIEYVNKNKYKFFLLRFI